MVKNLLILSAVLLTLVFMIVSASAYDCEYSRDIEQDFDVTGLETLEITARAGSLEIIGQSGTEQMRLEALLCAEEKEDLNELAVTFDRQGNKGVIEAVIPRSGRWSDNHHKSIDLNLRVPAKLAMQVEDSSGSATVEGVASLIIDDSSGSLEIIDIGGSVEVRDSSGSLLIRKIKGKVTVTDSSGGIEIEDVDDDVHIIADSSGSITIEDVGKNVLIDKDSSGSIDVDQVAGDFVVLKDGSGGIYYSDVGGRVDIPERKKRRHD